MAHAVPPSKFIGQRDTEHAVAFVHEQQVATVGVIEGECIHVLCDQFCLHQKSRLHGDDREAGATLRIVC